MLRTLVLIRHAHRDNSRPELDNGLSEKGLKQSRRLREFALRRIAAGHWRQDSVHVVSSPKQRCLETVAPLAEKLGQKIFTDSRLLEAQRGEGDKALTLRAEGFIRDWSQGPWPVTLVCSHGDWLPLATYHLLGIQVDFKKGAWLELEYQGRAHLRWYIPTFKHFDASF